MGHIGLPILTLLQQGGALPRQRHGHTSGHERRPLISEVETFTNGFTN